jgi:hypothetical protein
MASISVDDLLAADDRLTHSFAAAVAAALATIGWVVFFGPNTGPAWLHLMLVTAQFGCYIWYAVAAGTAASALGGTGWHFVAWILAAPFAALIPIPIVSAVIGVSPLAIKFLLGGQLQSAIRESTFEAIHQA